MTEPRRDGGDAAPGGPATRAPREPFRVPAWRWGLWSVVLLLALIVFYGLFTPVWFGLRSLAWLAEYRARRRRRAW